MADSIKNSDHEEEIDFDPAEAMTAEDQLNADDADPTTDRYKSEFYEEITKDPVATPKTDDVQNMSDSADWGDEEKDKPAM